MAYTVGEQLTEQFYAWETAGRGYAVSDCPAQLEPPFVPFFGHCLRNPYIDDGRQATLLSRIRNWFVPEHAVVVPQNTYEREKAFDDTADPSITVYSVNLARGHGEKPEAVEQCLTILSECKTPISFEIVATAASIRIQLTCRDATAPFVHAQLSAYFPDCTIAETPEDNLFEAVQTMQSACLLDFGLEEEFMRPIASYGGRAHDPYTSLLGVFDQLREGQTVIVQALFSGTQNAWTESIVKSVSDGRGGSFFANAPEMPLLAREKVSRSLFAATVRLAALAPTMHAAQTLLQHSAVALRHGTNSPTNTLVPLSDEAYTAEMRLSDMVMRQSHRVGMLLNSKELATLVHFPDTKLSKKLTGTTRTTKPAPAHLRDQPYRLGTNEHQGQTCAVGIGIEQRLRHVHMIGGTGTGKSTLLHNLIMQDIHAGIGCCVLDPHGDLIDAVLHSVPANRINDVVLVDPSDSEFPVGFNILSAYSDLERELLASDLVALFRRFSTSWGDQMHGVLANAIMAFLYNTVPGHIGDLRRFLIETPFRNKVLSTCTDGELAYYWQKEYPLLKTSSIGSILTRLDSFLRPKAVRGMVCQTRGLDMSRFMDGGKIVLVKLSQGLIGEENSHLLGACIVAKLQQAAMARQQQSAAERVPFFCYIDEFHHFVTPSMSTILSGTRKYSLGLVLAHQEMQQVQRHGDDVSGALMANAGTRICFRLSDTDARRMQDGFSGFNADDFQKLGIGEAIARVNAADADFNLSVSPTDKTDHDYTEEIKRLSRSQYGAAMPAQPVATDAAMQDEPHSPPPKPVPAPSPSAKDAPPAQKPRDEAAVREHRYLQSHIKSLAEQSGYRASLEVATPDGRGKIDVVLERGEERIAVEVSVTTGAEWEAHNVQKCLAAGYAKVVVCSGDQRKLARIRGRLEASLPPADLARILLASPEELPSLFGAPDAPGDAVAVMKGYRVKVRYDESSKGASRSDIVNRIIGGKK